MNPIKGLDGEEMREIAVRNGTKVTIGLMASNTNPRLWGADADEWKPDRWLSPLPEEVTAAHLPGVYSNLLVPRDSQTTTMLTSDDIFSSSMTFIGGSRACMWVKLSPYGSLSEYDFSSGFKFSQLEMSEFRAFYWGASFTESTIPEVVLSLLIQAFRFSPSKAQIFWQMSGIVVPIVVGGDPNTPQLPLVVERV